MNRLCHFLMREVKRPPPAELHVDEIFYSSLILSNITAFNYTIDYLTIPKSVRSSQARKKLGLNHKGDTAHNSPKQDETVPVKSLK